METFYTIILTCGLCNKAVGTAMVSSTFGWSEQTANEPTYNLMNRIVDHRCTDCEAQYGNFKQMGQEYMEKTGASGVEAEQFVRDNPKRDEFNEAISAKIDI